MRNKVAGTFNIDGKAVRWHGVDRGRELFDQTVASGHIPLTGEGDDVRHVHQFDPATPVRFAPVKSLVIAPTPTRKRSGVVTA